MESDNADIASAASTTAKVAERISLFNFVTFLEKTGKCVDSKDKLRKLSQYFDHLRSSYKKLYGSLDASHANGDSLFSVVRILLPSEDKERRAYGMKSPTLAKIFARILCLDEKSEDGRKLIHFKDPEKSGLSAGAGNLPNVIASLLEKRLSSTGKEKSPTLTDLHLMLDKIAKSDENNISIDGQVKILRNFILRLSPLEGKWLSKILLKKLGLGLSTQQIFKCFHLKAQECFNHCGSLEAVCIRLNDPSSKLVEGGTGVQLFQPFKPMLCDRVPFSVTKASIREQAGLEMGQKLVLPPPPFLIEIKFDGERFTVHYDSEKPPGGQFCYFSRAGNNWADVFNLTFTPRLKPQISESCKSFILDGEMMAWDFISKCFTQKGDHVNLVTLKSDDPRHCPALVVFDIIYFNGEDLTSKPLKERIEILHKIGLLEKEGVIQFNKQTLAYSEEQVLSALDEAVNNLEEGLILKDLSSKYLVGKRVSSWLKVKPEFFDDHNVADLDLVIVGGYYTKSFVKGGVVNHFLAALVDKSQQGSEVFYPLSRLGPGCLTKKEVNQLVEELAPNFNRNENPSFNIKMQGIKRPDFYIDPKKSLVVQVKAAEILHNESVALKHNLRFPRLVAVRRDKSWDEAMTVQEFHKVRITYAGKLSCSRDRSLPHTPLKDSVEPYSLSHPLQPFEDKAKTHVSKTPQKFPVKMKHTFQSSLQMSTVAPEDKLIEDVFHSRIFVVLGSLGWKPKVEALIRQYGGSIIQNPTKSQNYTVFAIIAENLSMKTVAFSKQDKYDILKLSWVDKCIADKTIVKILPEHVWSAGPATKEILSEEYDEYGDSYTEPLTSIETKRLINDIIANEKDSETEDEEEESPHKLMRLADLSEEFEEEDWLQLRKYNFLDGCKVAFRNSGNENSHNQNFIISTQIKFYGGEVAEDENEEGVTHVIVFDVTTPSKKKHLTAHVVKENWLKDCLAKKEIVDELYYMVE